MKTLKITPKHYKQLTGGNLYLNFTFADSMAEYPIPKARPLLDTLLIDDLDPNILNHQLLRDSLYALRGKPGQIFATNDEDEFTPNDPPALNIFHLSTSSPLDCELWLKQFEADCLSAFSTAGGDDDTFDYIPFFIYLFQDLLTQMGLAAYIPTFRKKLYAIDPEFPEFFTDQELTQFTK